MTSQVRPAVKQDAPTLLRLFHECNIFHKLKNAMEGDLSKIEEDLFGENPLARVLVYDEDGSVLGCALYTYAYSVWKTRRSIHLEVLFVDEEARGKNVGRQLMRHLTQEALDNECSHVEWIVADWNDKAAKFYTDLGAKPLKEWIRYKIDREEMRRLHGHEDVSSN
eukprot:Blabericola_migrator_1__8971@NODE_4771_length_986_cov_163_351469_g2974_i0_p1_GENE_NODE_4771_length_986_cov_163_351469_g2974_i0NODE_4771_length_986_cov_163_351469_g2974_i0_p1_ORF_typecomplete_len166_score21_40Acetyltransf_1/PF00583_25/1_1e19Acetyltransf_10/PF13673_7/2_7e14Acetyltransf_7/PF13508_7/1_4e11Acetyltransf_4/PF13420_7/3_8e09FR47/PF08445_10/1_1e07Acetyltransf_9/PF13527_7/7_7e06GNAT_acetyltran/PF12746_7/1_3e05Acetyltransf_3/PF13302_7/3_5e05Acetyltransf_6/PF13480_7/4_3e05Acetyltransf_8/PF13